MRQPQQRTGGLPSGALALRVTSSSLRLAPPAEPAWRLLLQLPGQDWFQVCDSCLQLGRAEGQTGLVLATHLHTPPGQGSFCPAKQEKDPAVKVVRWKERANAFALPYHVLCSPESAMLSLLIWGSHSPKLLTNRAGRPQATAAPRKTGLDVPEGVVFVKTMRVNLESSLEMSAVIALVVLH